MTAPLDVYAAGLTNEQEELVLRYADGSTRSLPVGVWTAADVPGDDEMLQRCLGATLDVGCGPGRLTVALGRRGVPALGVDIAPAAVRLARARGALALSRSVFTELPGQGRWRSALLADGNIGIGGDPVGLLRRLRQLLADEGRVVVEVDPPGAPSGPVRVRIEHAGEVRNWFPWAHLSIDQLEVTAGTAGFVPLETWTAAGRWFAVLVRS